MGGATVGYQPDGRYIAPAASGASPKVEGTCEEAKVVDGSLRVRFEALTEEAVNAVTGARNKDYGEPRLDMLATAEMMSGYLHKRGLLTEDQHLEAFDVPMLLEMVKLSRLGLQPGHHDSMVDVIGWMGVYQECLP